MLPERSILLQVCLIYFIASAHCQQYESDYGSEEDDDHSNYQGESNHPDYSKYFSGNNAAPLIAETGHAPTGFLSPIEFGGFSGPSPIEFGASQQKEVTNLNNAFVSDDKNKFGFADLKQDFSQFQFPNDYFERSQKTEESKQQDEPVSNYKISSGPSYISHHLPAKIEGSYTKDIEKYDDQSDKDKNRNYEHINSKQTNSENKDYKFEDDDYADYSNGKSSSSASRPPKIQEDYEKYGNSYHLPTPYQKYSFQPTTESGLKTKYLGSLLSTAAPFNPSYTKLLNTPQTIQSPSTANVPSHLQNKNCKRVKRSVDNKRAKREVMDCFICKDPKSSSKYTQCSYTAAEDPVNYYAGNSERYSIPAKEPGGFRYKRYADDDDDDPYEYVKSKSLKQINNRKPVEEETKHYGRYHADDEYDDAPDKSYSEIQSEELRNNPANCHKIRKDGMTCTICKNEKTGGNYEQCSYTVEPKEEKYAYVSNKKYDSADEPQEESRPLVKKHNDNYRKESAGDDDEDEDHAEIYTQEPEVRKQLTRKYSNDHSKPKTEKVDNYENRRKFNKKSRKLVEDDPYEIPKHFIESSYKEEETAPSSSEAEKTEENPEKSLYTEIDEYHDKVFPDYTREESQRADIHGHPAEASRQDVEEVLAEFSKKDRSSCKKAEKRGMTCYLCVDKNGIQNEECMYVSESKPKATHVAYHEVKQVKSPKEDREGGGGGKNEGNSVSTKPKRKRFYKKVLTTPAPITLETPISRDDSHSKYQPVKNRRRTRESVGDSSNIYAEQIGKDDPTPTTPTEFRVTGPEGAYSAETKPVYSKALGVKLPKYMLEKSAFEKDFDQFAGEF